MFHFYQNKTVPGPTPPNSRQPCSFNSLAKDNFMPSLVEVSGCLRSLRPKHISDDVLKIFFGHDDNDVLNSSKKNPICIHMLYGTHCPTLGRCLGCECC